MCTNFYLELSLLLLYYAGCCVCDNFCSGFYFVSQFNNEINNLEFGIGNYPKSLYCCAVNYDSILWFKKNKTYPWSYGESNFIVDPRSKNQTLYVHNLSINDAGQYSCHIITNNSVQIRHIHLKVFNHEFSGTPVVTREPPSKVHVQENETVRLYCETFVGKIDLPDARTKIGWHKVGENNTKITLANTSRIFLHNVTRDNGLTIGLQLVIEKVKKEDFGPYICMVSNTGDQVTKIKSELVVLNGVRADHLYVILDYFVIFILVTMVCLLFYKCGHKMMIFARLYTITECNSEKNNEFDAFILFDPDESQFVNEMLVPTLMKDNYKITSYDFQKETFLSMDCQTRMSVSRKVLIVLPCPRDGNSQDQKDFALKLHTASNVSNKVLCLLVQENPELVDQRSMQMVNSMKHVTYMKWPMYRKDWSHLWWLLKSHLRTKCKSEKKINNNNKNFSVINHKNIVCSV